MAEGMKSCRPFGCYWFHEGKVESDAYGKKNKIRLLFIKGTCQMYLNLFNQ